LLSHVFFVNVREVVIRKGEQTAVKNTRNLYGKWMSIFAVLLIAELFIEIIPLFKPDVRFFLYASIIGFLWTMLVNFALLRGMAKAAIELRANKQKLKSIFDSLDVAIWSHDLKADRLLITPGIEKLYGYNLEEFYQDFKLWKKVIHPKDLDAIKEREQRIAMGEIVTNEYRIIRPDGKVRWIQDRGVPTLNNMGQLIDFHSVLFDITDRKESEDRYRSLVEMSPDIIAVIFQKKFYYINQAGCQILGALSPKEILGESVWKFTPDKIYDEFQKLVDGNCKRERKTIEIEIKRLDGLNSIVEVSAMPIIYEGRQATQIVGRDITERKKAEKTIKTMAFHDSLTELPNRNKFSSTLNEIITQKKEKELAIFFLDLDRFKQINDTKGHSVGDLLLKKVAEYLQQAVGNNGMVSRYGGDEFIILANNMDKQRASLLAQKILDQFSEVIELERNTYFITPSIGISLYPLDGSDVESLIQKADSAMYQAKENGKNNFQFFSCELANLALRKVELENDLRKALEKKSLQLYYQPQINLETGKMVGVEALLRWKHPKYGDISPAEFIPLAEESGLIVSIGKWVLKTACEQNKAWQNAGFDLIPIAVNISVRQFQDEHFVDMVLCILNSTKLDPAYLELEITESILQNLNESTKILNQLKEHGIGFSIDDFGTGYSSLSYLRHLPLDKIKIDKSFLDHIDGDSHQRTMVKTIIDMGHNLGFTVVAEGIEKLEQVNILKEYACQIGQGYYFSKPLIGEKMNTFLKEKGCP
jgi:diguanylate cyclase (GGDEF)-like protein/PAS domain S-box-containing protein